MSEQPIIAIRLAHADETPLLRRLAALDSAPAPRGPVLVALVDGEAVAALALRDGRVVADPFVPTAPVVELLRARAAQLAREASVRRALHHRRAAVLAMLVPARRAGETRGRAA